MDMVRHVQERTMSDENHDRLAPKLDELQERLETAREEICDIPHVSELDTGEFIRVEETLAIAAEAAKEVVSVKRRIRIDRERRDRMDHRDRPSAS